MFVFVVIAKRSIVWVLLAVMVSWWLNGDSDEGGDGVWWHLFRGGSQEGFVVACMVFSGCLVMVMGIGYWWVMARFLLEHHGGDDC
ncbi:hypothetical protein Tco_0946611 [Tanacetum coccineum]